MPHAETNGRERRVAWALALPCFLLLPTGLGLLALARRYPADVDLAYSRTFFPPVRRALSAVAGVLPVSLAETLLGLLFLLVLVRTVRGVRAWRRGERTARNLFAHAASQVLGGAGLAYAAFLVLWGLNHARLPLDRHLALERAPATVSELASVVDDLVTRMNSLRAGIEAGDCALRGNVDDPRLQAAFASLARDHAVFDGALPPLRRPWASALLPRLGVTGIYSPFTGESHVAGDLPDVSVPFTTCHEIAHALGFAREDEANFIAYLACRAAGDAAFEYSGTRAAYGFAVRRLLSADPELALEIAARRSALVLSDSEAVRRFWREREGVLADVGRASNDLYLRSQGQDDGVRSYGRMVDLLIAESRLREEPK